MDWKRDTVNRPGDSLPLFDRRTHDSSLHAYDMEASCANRSSALAALRLLISYNHFLTPPVKQQSRTNVFLPEGQECQSNNWHRRRTFSGLRVSNTHSDVHSVVGPLLAALPPPPSCLPPYCQHLPTPSRHTAVRHCCFTEEIDKLVVLPQSDPVLHFIDGLSTCEEVRRRGEKRPIPPELKDDKYFERRRRNNQAAKKSRDARRIREDQIAWRACILEQENASLRAHVAALRQEALALRGLLAARDDALPSAAPAPPAPSSTTPD